MKDGGGQDMKKALTPVKAIRAKCIDCSCNQYTEVKACPVTDCALYPYRLGHRPPKVENNTPDESES